MSDPTPWESQGCEVCRRQWEAGDRPLLVAENIADHSELYRCEVCGTWWLLTERHAVAVDPDDIRSTYGEYVDDPTRYFVRQLVRDGVLVPFALLRRTVAEGRPVDEVLRDVDVWAPDSNASVDKAIRMPLESDLEEISSRQAAEVQRMVAERSYRPLMED